MVPLTRKIVLPPPQRSGLKEGKDEYRETAAAAWRKRTEMGKWDGSGPKNQSADGKGGPEAGSQVSGLSARVNGGPFAEIRKKLVWGLTGGGGGGAGSQETRLGRM